MASRRLGTWPDRFCWLILGVAAILLATPRRFRLDIALPLQTVLLAPLRATAAVRSAFADLRAENRRLTRLAAQLAVENARLHTAARAMASGEDLPGLVAARVIGRDIPTFSSYLIVSRGTASGIRTGCPALVPDGVIGVVTAAGPHQSLVQTLFGPEVRLAVIDRRSRVPAVCRAEARGRLVLDYVPKDADLAEGDTLVTAGLGGVFPKGLSVGCIEQLAAGQSPLFRRALARPFADLSRTEELFIMVLPDTLRPGGLGGWLENLAPPEVAIPPHGDTP